MKILEYLTYLTLLFVLLVEIFGNKALNPFYLKIPIGEGHESIFTLLENQEKK